MRFVCITDVPLSKHQDKWFAYSPYVVELNLWLRHVDEVVMVCPEEIYFPKNLLKPLEPKGPFVHKVVPAFRITNMLQVMRTLTIVPIAFFAVCREMRRADHIHLRCPNNMGLIGCIAQVFFPRRKKSAKYAGNWDPNSKQPWSYRAQQFILRNRFLTRNMRVMVYGNWEPSNANLLPFFTATYSKVDVPAFEPKQATAPLTLLYAGYLTPNKRPEFGIQLIEALKARGVEAFYHICGDGPMRESLAELAVTSGVAAHVFLHGNVAGNELQQLYRSADFSLLLSKSEGWPKAVAEAMFWGCIPIATAVSCVPEMLNNNERGILVETPEPSTVANEIISVYSSADRFHAMRKAAMAWSAQFTLEKMEAGIKEILQH